MYRSGLQIHCIHWRRARRRHRCERHRNIVRGVGRFRRDETGQETERQLRKREEGLFQPEDEGVGYTGKTEDIS